MKVENPKPGRCCRLVHREGYLNSGQCKRKGVVERNGNLYCKQHDPEEAKARRERERQEMDRRMDALERKGKTFKVGAILMAAGLDTVEKVKALLEPSDPKFFDLDGRLSKIVRTFHEGGPSSVVEIPAESWAAMKEITAQFNALLRVRQAVLKMEPAFRSWMEGVPLADENGVYIYREGGSSTVGISAAMIRRLLEALDGKD